MNMKKNYLKPTTEVVKIEQQCHLLSESVQATSVQATMDETFTEVDL